MHQQGDDTPVDLEPLDLTEEAAVVDEIAEELAVSGPADNARETTPTVKPVCRECGGPLEHLAEDWRPPISAKQAWREYKGGCVMVGKDQTPWSFCRYTGGCWVGGVRIDLDRRKTPREPPWNGVERRKTPGTV